MYFNNRQRKSKQSESKSKSARTNPNFSWDNLISDKMLVSKN